MKHQLLTWIFATVLTVTAIGQTNRFDIGIEAGPGVNFFWGNKPLETYGEPAVGFAAGLAFRYNFPKHFSIGTSLSFERKGNFMKYSITGFQGVDQVKQMNRYDYLTLPILARFTVGRRVRFFLNAGPYFGYLIKQSSKTRSSKNGTNNSDFTDSFKRIDIGITTGVGLGIPIKDIFVISLEARNNTGLYDIGNSPFPNGTTMKTNSTNFLVGLTYILGKRPE
jgi:hypothetical protein